MTEYFDQNQAVPPESNLDQWQADCRAKELEYQEWLNQLQEFQIESMRQEQALQEERQEQQAQAQRDREIASRREADRAEQQRRESQQAERDRQQKAADRRAAAKAAEREQKAAARADRQPDLSEVRQEIGVMERSLYLDEQSRRSAQEQQAAPKGLDRHDFYNIDTARELESAASRARSAGINPSNESALQRFLDRESEAGVNQVEGKRSLGVRFQELRDRRDEAQGMERRGVNPQWIPKVQLYESAWEQNYRLDREQQIFERNLSWASAIENRLAQSREVNSVAAKSQAEPQEKREPQEPEPMIHRSR